jgi:hypothetical protein
MTDLLIGIIAVWLVTAAAMGVVGIIVFGWFTIKWLIRKVFGQNVRVGSGD